MYKKAMVIMGLLFLTSCVNSPTTRGGGSSNYATRDVEVLFGDEQTYPRIALVIGNNNYQRNKKLTNAVPDARAIRDFLTKRDFRVVYAEDANRDTMQSKINEFMGGLGKKSLSVIYYAGHATQDKSRKTGEITNYLVPIDDNSLTSVTDYDRDAISMNYILNKTDELNHGLNIAMLDACRTPIGRGGSIQNIGAEGVYLVYSTASGTSASDSGAFRRSFLKYANQPLKLTDIFGKVKMDLIKEGQRPSIQDDAVGIFYFTTAKQPTSKWITPRNTICKAIGGRIDKNGGCLSNLNNAKKICKISGGKLPTIHDLHKIIIDCGGIINDINNNINNDYYQQCYRKKGFTNNYYWSSTKYKNTINTRSINLKNGHDYWDFKSSDNYIRCVRI